MNLPFKHIIHLLFVGGYFLFGQAAAQSGWTKGKGKLFAKVSYLHFVSTNYHDLSGEQTTTSKFHQQAIGLYAEYGLTDRLTVVMDWPMVKTQGFETTQNVWGTGNLQLGLKYAISKKVPITFTILPEYPIAAANKYAVNKNPAYGRINLPTGDGEFNIYNILAISHSFYPIPAYMNLYGSFNLRTHYEDIKLSNQMIEGFEVGYNPVKPLWLKAGMKLQQTLSNANATVSFVRGEGTEFTSFYAGAYYALNRRWGVDFNYFGYLQGPQQSRNIYNGPTLNLGVVFELK